MKNKPKIEGCINRAIEELEEISVIHPDNQSLARNMDDLEYAKGRIAIMNHKAKKALADLKAFKEALPDDLDEWLSTQSHPLYDIKGRAAKLTAEAVSEDLPNASINNRLTAKCSKHIECWDFIDDGGNECIGFFNAADRDSFKAMAENPAAEAVSDD